MTEPNAVSQTRQNNNGTTDSQVAVQRRVTYIFNTVTTADLKIPYAVAVDGVAKPEFSEQAASVRGPNARIEVTVNAGQRVALFLNSDAHPSFRQNPVYEVTPTQRNIQVTVTEKAEGTRSADPDTPVRASTDARRNLDLYRAPLTGDIWMKISHKYPAAEVDALVPAGTSAEVLAAVKSIYDVLPSAELTLNVPAAPPLAALTVVVTFVDSNNPRRNITSYGHLADGLPRVHPGGFAALLSAAVEARAPRISLSSCWRPSLGSIAHRAGLGLDVTLVGGTAMALSAPTRNDPPAMVQTFRRSLTASPRVMQLFDPWFMDSETGDNVAATRNPHQSRNDKLHATHLHITVREDKIL
jgi:hypothetical protein